MNQLSLLSEVIVPTLTGKGAAPQEADNFAQESDSAAMAEVAEAGLLSFPGLLAASLTTGADSPSPSHEQAPDGAEELLSDDKMLSQYMLWGSSQGAKMPAMTSSPVTGQVPVPSSSSLGGDLPGWGDKPATAEMAPRLPYLKPVLVEVQSAVRAPNDQAASRLQEIEPQPAMRPVTARLGSGTGMEVGAHLVAGQESEKIGVEVKFSPEQNVASVSEVQQDGSVAGTPEGTYSLAGLAASGAEPVPLAKPSPHTGEVETTAETGRIAAWQSATNAGVVPDAPIQPAMPAVVTTTGESVTPTEIRTQVLTQLWQVVANQDGEQKITLQLDPPHLGKVEVQIQQDGGKLSITFHASSPAAEHALREGSDELAEVLLVRGGRWSEVEVRLERGEADSRGQKGQDQEKQQRREQTEDRERRGKNR